VPEFPEVAVPEFVELTASWVPFRILVLMHPVVILDGGVQVGSAHRYMPGTDLDQKDGRPMPREPEAKDSSKSIRLQDTLRLSAEGVAKVLGDLEARVMHAVWDLEAPVPARAVHEKVIVAHPVAIHTVITVLNKLVEKGLLCRKKQEDILHYCACVSEEELRKQVSRRAVEGILSLGPQAVAASFVDLLAERGPEQLAELMRLIQDRIHEQEDSLIQDRIDEQEDGG
jgi:predicted transcriptional regulator